jgi:hypothetical protein
MDRTLGVTRRVRTWTGPFMVPAVSKTLSSTSLSAVCTERSPGLWLIICLFSGARVSRSFVISFGFLFLSLRGFFRSREPKMNSASSGAQQHHGKE